MQRIGVVGATGYTGFELLRLLSCHDSVELVLVTSEKYNEKNRQAQREKDRLSQSTSVGQNSKKVDLLL